MSAACIRPAGPAKRIELVDEDNRWRVLTRLLEQVANPGGADADEHLDKFRARDRKERDSGFASDGAGQQGLAGAWRTDQQHTLRRSAAQSTVYRRLFQEIDDLDQFVFGLVDPGNIGERNLRLLLDVNPGAALADRHQPAEAALTHAPDREHPDANKEDRGQNPGQQIAQPVSVDDTAVNHVVLV